MNWGKGIAALYIGFVVLVLATVVFTFTQRVDLVTDNYYEKELKFQEQIDRLERTKGLPQKLILENNRKEIIIKFPVKPDPGNKDTIIFYKPSDPSKDVRIPVNADSLGKQTVPVAKLAKGFLKAKILWTSNGKEYYAEEILNIP